MISNHKNRKYEIVSYNPKWINNFKKEAKILKSIFSKKIISIEHIGSTSVPGLSGKPTIDILIVVKDVFINDIVSNKMEREGYQSLGEYVTKGAILFAKEKNNMRLFNIHIFKKGHSHIKDMLNLRDYLIKHPKIIKEYSKLKIDLYKKYPNDYSSYRKLKDKWMENFKKTACF